MLKLLTIWMQSPSLLVGSWGLVQDTLMSTTAFLLTSGALDLGSSGSREVGKCLWLWVSWLGCVRGVFLRCRFFSVGDFIKQKWQGEQPMTRSLVIVDYETNPFGLGF